MQVVEKRRRLHQEGGRRNLERHNVRVIRAAIQIGRPEDGAR